MITIKKYLSIVNNYISMNFSSRMSYILYFPIVESIDFQIDIVIETTFAKIRIDTNYCCVLRIIDDTHPMSACLSTFLLQIVKIFTLMLQLGM